MNGECVDNYVVSCSPAPKTPASEVVVVRTDHETLAVTGGELEGSLVVAAVVLVVLGGPFTFFRRAVR